MHSPLSSSELMPYTILTQAPTPTARHQATRPTRAPSLFHSMPPAITPLLSQLSFCEPRNCGLILRFGDMAMALLIPIPCCLYGAHTHFICLFRKLAGLSAITKAIPRLSMTFGRRMKIALPPPTIPLPSGSLLCRMNTSRGSRRTMIPPAWA